MQSSVSVFERQAVGYDRYVRENWQELDQWERDMHSAFRGWAGDTKKVRRFVAHQTPRGRARSTGWGTTPAHGDAARRTLSLSYALLLASVFFFPIALAGAGGGLGFINSLRNRWDHGLIQITLAGAIVAAYINGISLSAWVFDTIERMTPVLR